MRAFGASTHSQSLLPLLKGTQIVGNVWILGCERFDIADFHVDFLYAGPFCARAEEPTPLSNDACSVERIAGDQKLHALTRAQIRTDYGAFACSIFVQHQNFNRITEVTVIQLIVANAVESYRGIRRHHEIECGAGWPTIKKWCREPAGCNSLVADKCHAHEAARAVRLQFEEPANFFGCQIVGHLFWLKIQRPTSNVQRRTSN